MHHTYREFCPDPALADVVERYWTIEAAPGPGEKAHDLILPDGCIDVIFDLSPGCHGDAREAPVVIGTMTRALEVETAGPLKILGVRFRPGGATPFVPVAADALTDSSAPLDSLWGREADDLWERLVLAGSSTEAFDVLNRVLGGHLDRSNERLDRAVLTAGRIATSQSGRVTVETLAESVGMGRRQLERRFRTAVGIGPKLSCSIARFRSVVGILNAHSDVSLSRVAFRAGYADQPHMNRDFKRLAGVSPGAYRRSLGSSAT